MSCFHRLKIKYIPDDLFTEGFQHNEFDPLPFHRVLIKPISDRIIMVTCAVLSLEYVLAVVCSCLHCSHKTTETCAKD